MCRLANDKKNNNKISAKCNELYTIRNGDSSVNLSDTSNGAADNKSPPPPPPTTTKYYYIRQF